MSGATPVDVEARFWAKVSFDGDCWEWTGARTAKAYGSVRLCGRTWRAHLAAYALLFGCPPNGLEADHLCRNRGCVNVVSHIEFVSHAENLRRGQAPAAINARKTQCIRGHALTGANLAPSALQVGRRQCRACIAIRNRRAYERRRETRIAAA